MVFPGSCPDGDTDTCGFWLASCPTVKTNASGTSSLVAAVFWPDMPAGRAPDVVDLVSLNTFPEGILRYHFRTENGLDPFTTLAGPTHEYRVGDGTTRGLGARNFVAANLASSGKLDLAVAAQDSNEVSVLLNISTPDFFAPVFDVSVEYPAGDTPSWVAAGDFVLTGAGSPDGATDIVVCNQSTNRVSVLKNVGTGALARPAWWQTGPAPDRVLVSRINADLVDDVVTVGSTGINVLQSRADTNGGFDVAPQWQLPGAATCVAAGDVDGDTLPDSIVATTDPNEVYVFLGQGDGRFSQATLATPLATAAAAMTSADLDGDSKVDVAVACDDGLRVLLSAERGSFWDTGLLSTRRAGDVVAAPFFGASMALAASFPDDNRVCLYEYSGCDFVSVTCAVVGFSPTALAVGDFDQSNAVTCPGCLDLAVLDTAGGNLSILRQDAGRSFTAGSAQSTTALDPVDITSGDFNRDGIADLAVAHTSGDVVVHRGSGTDTLSPGQTVSLGFGPSAIVAGSFDNDAGLEIDLAVTLADAAATVVLSGLGDGTFLDRTQIAYGVGANPVALAAAQFEPASYDGLMVAADDASLTYLGAQRQLVFPPASAGPDRAVGPTDVTQLGGPGDPANLTYSWSPATGLSATNVPMPDLSASSLTGDTTFTLDVTHVDTGLINTEQVNVVFPGTPVPVITPPSALCCTGGAPTLLQAEPGYTHYSWSTGDTTRCLETCPATSGLVDLTVRNWAGIEGTNNVMVDVGTAPVLSAALDHESRCATVAPCGSAGTLATTFMADVARL